VGVEIDALKDSHAYKQGAALADLRRHAGRVAEFADRDEQVAGTRASEQATAAAELEGAKEDMTTASANHERAEREVRLAAQGAGADDVVSEAVTVADPDDAERLVQAWVGARRARIEEVCSALARHDRAVFERSLHEERVAEDEAAVEGRGVALSEAVSAHALAVSAYRMAVEDWARGCETVGPERVTAALPQPPEVPADVINALAELTSDVQTERALARRELQAERKVLEDEVSGLSAERNRWAEHRLPDPEAPTWRSDRTGLSGAPLWALVDPRPGTPDAEVDRVEAALAGAGLLDAWVQPDGTVDLGTERADLVLTVGPRPGDTLGSLVVPCGTTGVSTAVVDEVVGSIPVVESALTAPAGADHDSPDVAVGRDGTYRVGAAVGRGPVRPARLLGAPARERHRLARLTELDAAITEVEVRVADVDNRAAAEERRRSAATAELSALPGSGPLDAADRARSDAATRLTEATSRLDATRTALREAENRVRNALRDLTTLAARHGLPTDTDGLTAAEEALSGVVEAAVAWGRRRRELLRAERDNVKAAEVAARADEAARTSAEAAAASRCEADELAGRVAALDSSVGAEYGEVLARISDLEQERTA
ncbi:MAG TPA: hypothetical protein VGR90_04410, partial [Acidimicrobiales bacterium]|nr:hypothetical protein [Acidimicrobiales bacterium]